MQQQQQQQQREEESFGEDGIFEFWFFFFQNNWPKGLYFCFTFYIGTDGERVRDGMRNVRDRFVRRGVRTGNLLQSTLRASVERSVCE